MAAFLEGDRDCRLTEPQKTSADLNLPPVIELSEADLADFQKRLKEATEAAQNYEKIIQKKKADLAKIRQRVCFAKEALKQAEQAEEFWEKNFPEKEELTKEDLQEAVQSKKDRLNEASAASKAEEAKEELEEASQVVEFLLREVLPPGEEVVTCEDLKGVLQVKEEALDEAEEDEMTQEERNEEPETLADDRVWEIGKAFSSANRELLLDHCIEIFGFSEHFEVMWRCGEDQLASVIAFAKAINVGDMAAVRGLYIALKKSGYMRADENPARKEEHQAMCKKLLRKHSGLLKSIIITGSLLDRLQSAGLIFASDREEILSLGQNDGIRKLLKLIKRGYGFFEPFVACLREERQEAACKYLLCDNYTGKRAGRFNENWFANRDLKALVKAEGWLDLACCIGILDALVDNGIIALGLANQLKEEASKSGGNWDGYGILQGVFSRFTFLQICRAMEIIKVRSPELGSRIETDDIRQYYRDEQFKICVDKSVAVAQLVTTRVGWPIVSRILHPLFQRAPLIKPFSREKMEGYTGWLLSHRLMKNPRLTTDEPMQTEESPEKPEATRTPSPT